MAARALERFHHRNPSECFFTNVEHERIPVCCHEVVRIAPHAASSKVGPRVDRWFRDGCCDLVIIEEPHDCAPVDETLVQAACRIDVVVLQVEKPELGVVPVEIVTFAVGLEDP